MSLYTDRIAEGLCGSCGKEPRDGEDSLGVSCKQKSRDRAAAQRAKKREAGKCLDCPNPVKPGGVRCETCAKRQSEGQAGRVRQRKDRGLCAGCGKGPPKADCVLCQACIDKRSVVSSAHYLRRKEAGLCRFCNNPPVPGEVLCRHHKERYKDYRLQTKVETLEAYGGPVCCECGNPDAEVLEIDHIDGGGRKHFREEGITGGYSFYLWLRKNGYPPGYRVVCPTCNKKAYRKLRTRKVPGDED